MLSKSYGDNETEPHYFMDVIFCALHLSDVAITFCAACELFTCNHCANLHKFCKVNTIIPQKPNPHLKIIPSMNMKTSAGIITYTSKNIQYCRIREFQ